MLICVTTHHHVPFHCCVLLLVLKLNLSEYFQAPVLVLNMVVEEARNLEAKDADGEFHSLPGNIFIFFFICDVD